MKDKNTALQAEGRWFESISSHEGEILFISPFFMQYFGEKR